MIIDDGLPSRGRRKYLFGKDKEFIGISMIKNPEKGYKFHMCFTEQDYKAAYLDGI